MKRITKTNIEWRIRNLSYPVETYSVTADPDARCLIIRTTNKKYFKKIQVEELDRVNLCPEQKNIDFSHKYNTLIITVSTSCPSIFNFVFLHSRNFQQEEFAML